MIVPIHYQERTQTSLNDEQRQSFLESLRFKQIDARQMTIKTAHTKTCRWLLKNAQYLDWLDTTKLGEHHGFLWIKGHAGTGKSTLMKFALINARKTMRGRVVLSFFFNARGEDIEKSTIGVYRSLLLQLLERLPALQSIFDSLSLSTSIFSADHLWSIEPLKTLIEQAILALGQSRVVCFVDALDECKEQQVRDMIQFFEHIGELAVSNSICFQVCFSSRHYPHITIRNRLELILDGQVGHTQDITDYVEAELKIGKSKTAQQVRVELQEKASGIFMWVILVVDILNKEFDDGQVHALRQKLQEIPGDLHKLFGDILTRDSHNKYRLVLCIQWVLFAKQPLSPEQLYHALLSSIDPAAVLQWDPEETTKDDVKRFLLNSSKGLAEATVSKEPKVQFIHESVRDFLLKDNGLGKIWPEFESNFQGQSHEQLKQCCLTYIGLDIATPLKIPKSLPTASSPQAASLRKSAVQKFPFLEYAVQTVLHHANAAEGDGISQADFLAGFPISQWVELDNLFEKHQIRRHTKGVSCLYLLAELNMANLLKAHSSVGQCLRMEDERYGCPLFAAAATGSEETLELCMECVRVDRAMDIALDAVDTNRFQQKFAQSTARRDFVCSRSKEFLLCAAELGHDKALTFLVDSGRFKIDVKDSKDRTTLWWASKNGCDSAVRSLLLADPAMVNSKDRDSKSPLYIAAELGHDATVRTLLDNGADVNVQGGYNGNALQAASSRGHKEIAMLLLDKGADVNAQGGYYSNALQAASSRRHKEIAMLLLDKGADVNAQGGFYGNALQAAISRGYKEMAMLLLDKGADVKAQGGFYGNALQAALSRGYKEIAMLLLDKGADVNAQGGYYGNALQAAISRGDKEMAMLLLDKGADVNAQGGFHGSALQAASYCGYKDIAMLLQKEGALSAPR